MENYKINYQKFSCILNTRSCFGKRCNVNFKDKTSVKDVNSLTFLVHHDKT